MTRMSLAATTHNFAVRADVASETIIALSGELDLATLKTFEIVLDEIEFTPIRHLTLDLRNLTFIDASGLRGILRLYAICLDGSVRLTIRRGPRGVQRLFELTQTDWLLPFTAG